MDIEKAIDTLKCENELMLFNPSTGESEKYEQLNDLNKDCYDTHEFCIEALKELQQYRQIGTVDECKAAMEKQIAKTPDYEGDGYADGQLVYYTWICPSCGEHYEVGYYYCPKCGQHIRH